MAGFFGLFNYEKEGPGIYKNAPKKKVFFVFFETFFRNFWKFITINMVYNLLCLPLVTSGFATAGITNVTRNIARDKHSFGLSDFFETIKKNWKQSLIAGIINVVVYALLVFDVSLFLNSEGFFATFCCGVTFAILFIFLMMNFYIWTLMITFKFTLKQIYINSFKFVFINIKLNLLCGVILLLCYVAAAALYFFSFKVPFLFVVLMTLAFLFFPCFKFLLIQFCVFPSIKKYIIDPYYEEHPDEDIELRNNLGIETEDKSVKEDNASKENQEEEDPDAPIFED